MNFITSMGPQKVRIPIHFDTDKEVLDAVFETIGMVKPEESRVVRIKNTLKLDEVEVSERLIEAVKTRDNLKIAGELREMEFDSEDNLLPLAFEMMTRRTEMLNSADRKPDFRKVGEWIEIFENRADELLHRLKKIYGDDESLIEERISLFLRALKHFQKLYGSERKVVISRSPCRINLRGMHSEMQHATPNYLTHGREIIMVAGKRDDDTVTLENVDNEHFKRREFRISEEKKRGNWGDWVAYVDCPGVRECIESNRGDWANYVKASVLKLQDEYSDRELKGMDVVTFGDAPRGSGMSSSSAMVVSSALAFMAVNDLEMDCRELTVNLGRGEWYVGTRGGFGDHGAMIFGKQGHILHCVFLTVEEMEPEYIPIPPEYQVIIINSYKTSAKSNERLFAYNQTMFGYSMALTLIKDVLADMGEYSQKFLDELKYLGQITPETFGLRRIYEILRALPERISVVDLEERYSAKEIDARLDRFFGQLGKYPEHVEVRGAALWGIAESERSRIFGQLIKDGKIKEAGDLMYIGHDGDRLFAFNDKGEPVEYTENKVTDDYLDNLVADLKSDDPARVKRAQLARQPGDYDASSLELDTIVEIARKTPGIVGASLTGAGFGGNLLAFGKNGSAEALRKALLEGYYKPQETAELDWVKNDADLEAAFGDGEELKQIRRKLGDIVEKKRKTKSSMSEAEIEYAKSVQQKIDSLFREGKIGRELLFIPANYYAEGVTVNIPVESAGTI